MLAIAILPKVYASYMLFASIFITLSTLELYVATRVSYSGIFLHLYFSIGLFVCCFGYLVYSLQSSARDATDIAFANTARNVARERLSLPTKIRAYLANSAAAITTFLCWPASLFSPQTLHLTRSPSPPVDPLAMSATSTLFLLDTSLSVYTMLVSIGLTLFALRGEPPFTYSVYFLVMLAIATGVRHLSYLIGVETVQKRLRRSWGSPFIRFIAIALFDLVSIVLIYNAAVNWNSAIGVFDASALRQLLEQLFGFGGIIDLLRQPIATPLTYAIIVSGLLYYAALGRSISRFKDFERDDEDLAALAVKAATIGMIGEAIKSIDSMREPKKDGLLVASIVNAAAGNPDRGKAYAKKYLTVIDVSPTPSYLYAVMQGGMLLFPTSKENALKLITHAMAEPVNDVAMMDMVHGIIIRKRLEARTILDLFSAEETRGQFPLTFCHLKWMVDEEREVIEFFDVAGDRMEGAERMLWLAMHARIRIFSVDHVEAVTALEQWKNERLPEIARLNGEVEGSMEKIVVWIVLLQFADALASAGIGGWEPIQVVAKDIEATIDVNEFTLNTLRWNKAAFASGGGERGPGEQRR